MYNTPCPPGSVPPGRAGFGFVLHEFAPPRRRDHGAEARPSPATNGELSLRSRCLGGGITMAAAAGGPTYSYRRLSRPVCCAKIKNPAEILARAFPPRIAQRGLRPQPNPFSRQDAKNGGQRAEHGEHLNPPHCKAATSCFLSEHFERRLCKSPGGKDINNEWHESPNRQTRQQDRSHSCH